jgi:EpsI family protein
MRMLLDFARSRGVLIVTLILAAQALGLGALAGRDDRAAHIPFAFIPETIGQWRTAETQSLSSHEQANLAPDDYVARIYSDPARNTPLQLLAIYFASQRTERAPHSPRNCLPGNGWVPEKFQSLRIPAASGSATVNRVVVRNGDQVNLVLYWYHSATGAVANEYLAKIRLIADSILLGRSDTALVRITVPVIAGDEPAAEADAVRFAEQILASMERHLHP